MLYFKLYPFTLLKQSRSFTFLFMYLGELFQYYQSSNNLPQSAQTLDFDLKSCFVLLNTSSHSTRCWLAFLSLFVAFVCLGPWVILLVVVFSPSRSFMLCVAQYLELLCSFLTCLRLNLSSFVMLNTVSVWNIVSVSNFAALVCSTLRVDLLIVILSRLFQPFVLCVETSTRSACCSVVSGGYLNTLTFVGLVLVSSYFIHPSFWVFVL